MSSTIEDLSEYGNMKARDIYSRALTQSIKGDGVSASSLTQSFYGIPSTTDTEYQLASVEISEGVVDDEIGTYKISVNDGTSLNSLLELNNVASTLTTTDFTLAGTLHTSIIQSDSLAEEAKLELLSDAATPSMNVTLGTTTPIKVLEVTEAGVDVLGVLTVDGTDILQTITNGNAWNINGTTVETKAAYPLVEVNVLNAYNTSVALDVNGTIVDRGNDFFMYDTTGLTNLSTLSFDSAGNSLALRTSLADQGGNTDSLSIQTTDGNNNTYLNRLTFDGGVGDQNATFSNVNVGIGVTPSGTHKLEVVGTASITGNTTVVGDVDLSGNDLLNVSDIVSSDTLAEQATIVLTSSATDPQIDLILGDLGATPTTAMTLTEAAATINVETTVTDNLIVTGDFTVNGTTTTINTTEVEVSDKEIDLAYDATTHLELDGGGFTLGTLVTGITVPSILYSQTDTRWNSSIGVNVPSTGKVTVDGTTTELSSTGLDLNSDTSVIHIGATKQWRIRMENDGTSDHLYFEHDDLGTGVTWETKLDIMQ